MLPAWMQRLPFRLGTTSYILPAEILPNVRYLAGKVMDIELVLFELDDGMNNLPEPELQAELRRLASQFGLSYTVHLPLDLRLGGDGEEQSLSLVKTQRVIQSTQALEPWAYVLHLDGNQERFSTDPVVLLEWRDQAVRALEIVSIWAGGSKRLAVENLEGYPSDFNFPVLERLPVMQCIDIGHLWKDGENPILYLQSCMPRARVIHIHGKRERDHQSLAHTPTHQLDTVLQILLTAPFTGVVTLEIFNEEDLTTSLQAICNSLQRLGFE
jgi:sugar phosphate isomerase/epimerase